MFQNGGLAVKPQTHWLMNFQSRVISQWVCDFTVRSTPPPPPLIHNFFCGWKQQRHSSSGFKQMIMLWWLLLSFMYSLSAHGESETQSSLPCSRVGWKHVCLFVFLFFLNHFKMRIDLPVINQPLKPQARLLHNNCKPVITDTLRLYIPWTLPASVHVMSQTLYSTFPNRAILRMIHNGSTFLFGVRREK